MPNATAIRPPVVSAHREECPAERQEFYETTGTGGVRVDMAHCLDCGTTERLPVGTIAEHRKHLKETHRG